jgi:hypothetical protein
MEKGELYSQLQQELGKNIVDIIFSAHIIHNCL